MKQDRRSIIRSLRATKRDIVAPVFFLEPLEPRLLLSADLLGGAVVADPASLLDPNGADQGLGASINDLGEVVWGEHDGVNYNLQSSTRGLLQSDSTKSFYNIDINNFGTVVWEYDNSIYMSDGGLPAYVAVGTTPSINENASSATRHSDSSPSSTTSPT